MKLKENYMTGINQKCFIAQNIARSQHDQKMNVAKMKMLRLMSNNTLRDR